jgi:hypothetical protein
MIKCEFISKRYDAVIVKQSTGLRSSWSTLIEVAGEEIDRSKFEVGRYTYRLLMNENDSLARWQSRDYACQYVGETNIKKAEFMVRRQVRAMSSTLARGRTHPAYKAMLFEVERVVEHYTDDFHWHDVKMLGEYNPTKFIWCVRTCGTGIYLTSASIEWVRFYVDGKCGDKIVDFYVWNGITFYKVHATEVLGLVSYWLPNSDEIAS